MQTFVFLGIALSSPGFGFIAAKTVGGGLTRFHFEKALYHP
jgi:hypothetical protein